MLLLVKLRFKSALKVGGGDLAQGEEFRGILHSDTIFSAILNEWVRIYGRVSAETLLSTFRGDLPPFKISSAFPYCLDEYYLPAPYGTGELHMYKLKETPFLELYDFLDLASGNQQSILKKDLINPLENILFQQIAPRVSIDRISAATNVYQVTGWQFKEEGGLYFIIDLHDNALNEKLHLCIKMLGDSGFGGDRSVGYGLFDAEIHPINDAAGWLDLFQKRSGENIVYFTLSLCCPSTEEAKEAVSYQLLSRKSWIFSHSSAKQLKRRECKMIAEGSLFRNLIKGQLVDVTPSEFTEHNVYRYGLGMMIDVVDLVKP